MSVLRRTAVVLAGLRLAVAESNSPTFLDQGFSFDYTTSGVAVPVPTTTQCDSIPLSWERAAFTTGPDPVAPYVIQVYTSTFIFPMVVPVGDQLEFNWPVPFVPGTQYQICMFAANGVTGGCQRMYTVIPDQAATVNNQPTCANYTFPNSVLNVTAIDHTGDLSQYGWIDQCTDISITPENGTPPFILTIAPTLHPPWNITSPDMSAINWTVQLSWGSPFYISLVDSTGLSWAFGPLHSGGEGPTDCLNLAGTTTSTKKVADAVAIGSGVGGVVLGLLLGGLIAWLALRKRLSEPRFDPYEEDNTDRIQPMKTKSDGHQLESPVGNPSHYSAIPLTSSSPERPETSYASGSRSPVSRSGHRMLSPSGYEIEPFRMPSDASDVATVSNAGGGGRVMSGGDQDRSMSPTDTSVVGGPTASDGGSHAPQSPQSGQRGSSAVYVVHHDGGRAPVTVYTQEGTQVIELPPQYDGQNGPPDRRQRDPSATPRKLPVSPGPQAGPSS